MSKSVYVIQESQVTSPMIKDSNRLKFSLTLHKCKIKKNPHLLFSAIRLKQIFLLSALISLHFVPSALFSQTNVYFGAKHFFIYTKEPSRSR